MKKSIWVVVVLIACTVIGEAFARFILGLGDPPLTMEHPKIEYMFKPNQDVQRFGNRILINAYGMRSEAFPARDTGAELRVLVFGDSVVNGGNQTDHSKLATTILAQQLRSSTTQIVRVANVSAGSWGPGNWLAYVREYGFFNADAVVLVISSHDAGDNPTFAPLNPQTHPQSRPMLALWEGITRYLPRYLPQGNSKGTSESVNPGAITTDAAMQQGLADLDAFLALAQAQTPKVLVVQHPERSEIERNLFQPGHAAIYKLATERGISVIQFSPVLKRVFTTGGNPYRDNIHINDHGQRELAGVIGDGLLALGVGK